MIRPLLSSFKFSAFIFISLLVPLLASAQTIKAKKPALVLQRIPIKSIEQILLKNNTAKETLVVALILNPQSNFTRSTVSAICCLCYYPTFPFNQPIKVKLIDSDKQPLSFKWVMVSTDKGGRHLYRTDSAGMFTCKIETGAGEPQFSIHKTSYRLEGINQKTGNTLFHVVFEKETTSEINLNWEYDKDSVVVLSRYYWYSNSQDENEIINDKFRFRDVKQLISRYKDIYLRY